MELLYTTLLILNSTPYTIVILSENSSILFRNKLFDFIHDILLKEIFHLNDENKSAY